MKVWCSYPARAALRFAGKGTKLAELPIPANHRYGAGLGWSGEVRQMSAIGTYHQSRPLTHTSAAERTAAGFLSMVVIIVVLGS